MRADVTAVEADKRVGVLDGQRRRLQAARTRVELFCSEPFLKRTKFHGRCHLLVPRECPHVY